jgi:hypothetical protein
MSTVWPIADVPDPDGPAAGRDFSQWPLPIGEVKLRDDLTYVHAPQGDRFSVEDFWRIQTNGWNCWTG